MTKKINNEFSGDIEDTKNLAVSTLTGDVRDFLLDRVKQLGKPWVAMTEKEQSDQIHAARDAAERLVKKAVEIIASEGRKALVGQLVKVNIKDRLQCQVDFSKMDEQRHELIDSTGMPVLLVVADSAQFTGERAPAEPTRDQGDMLEKAETLKKSGGKVSPFKPLADA